MEINDDVLKILFFLRKNPRRSFLEISRKTGISLDKVYDIYYELNSLNMLKTYTFMNLPINKQIDVLIIIALKETLLDYLRGIINVNSIILTDREYILHCSFLSLKDYDIFLDLIENLGIDVVDEYFINKVLT